MSDQQFPTPEELSKILSEYESEEVSKIRKIVLDAFKNRDKISINKNGKIELIVQLEGTFSPTAIHRVVMELRRQQWSAAYESDYREGDWIRIVYSPPSSDSPYTLR